MLPASPPTGYARLSPTQARLVLAAIAATTVLLVAVSLSGRAIVNPGKPTGENVGDPGLYWAEAQRVYRGESYYDVLADELPARGYPTRSVFNWRTPLPVWLIGQLPSPGMGRGLVLVMGLVLLALSFEAVARDGSVRRALGTVCLLSGPLLLANQDHHFTMPVIWSGTLIALSLAACGLNRPGWGVALGVAALVFRELALPFVLVMAALALWRRRWRELTGWSIGLAAWLAFFGWHALQVLPRIGPDAIAHQESWIRLAGASFVLATVQMNAWLIVLPQWVAALYLVAAMVGLAGWSTPLGERIGLAACVLVTAFAVVGQPFNQYWGALIAPLFCYGVARAPASLGELCRRVNANLSQPATDLQSPRRVEFQ